MAITKFSANRIATNGRAFDFSTREGVVKWLYSHAIADEYHAMPVVYTPEAAKAVLEFLNTNNRQYREARGKKYGRTMRAGRWKRASCGVGYDEDFTITNGQHRLEGVVLADVPVELLTVFFCDKKSPSVEDDHALRGEADRLSTTGTPTSKREMSILKLFLHAPSQWSAAKGSNWDIEDLRAGIEKYREPIQFALDIPGASNSKNPICHAVILAAIARASRYEPRGRLAEFCAVFSSKCAERAHDAVAAKFSGYVDRHPDLRKGGNTLRVKFYKLCQTAIKAFIENRDIAYFRPTETDLWPLDKSPV